MPNNNLLFFLIALVVIGGAALSALSMALSLFRPWLQAFMAGAQVSLIDILGMRFRRIDPQVVIRSLILARQSGVEVSSLDLQRAYLRGVDLEKVTLAHIQAQKRDLGTTFDELVELELHDRLAKLLQKE
jgi:uncharacterized protein YqfA (UPF0365 family)